eukprot:CAMPEP_0196785448 /NCGR_PEP_ID=MMETSP1104-20130614/19340_1 /TAXON_ID=33652 /ORGANISM="Cafeteria sp., Strain Caron Lab Isolate" /LENGTH=74 /DNA_ID=CAMNT_0042155751 /DNA_START=68 /DNA_END=288 /DNA_ORIENTATION=-
MASTSAAAAMVEGAVEAVPISGGCTGAGAGAGAASTLHPPCVLCAPLPILCAGCTSAINAAGTWSLKLPPLPRS